ncbi:MAG: hypothetical protein RMJ82_14970, partial [Gemmatales bacterium]|nr:hypothetical protein [Gemmatales bacterium]
MLYVAMTRARERLVLIATHNRWTQPRKSARSRPEQSDEKFHLAADQIHSSLQWLLPVFRRATQNGYRALRLQEISSQDPVIHDFPAGSTSEPREDGQEPSTLSDGTTSSALSRDDWFNPTLWQRLHWKYPHHWATVWPGKTSPTRLRLWLERDEDTAPWSRGQRGLSLTSRPSFPRESPTLDNKHESTANVSATTPAAGSAVERGQLVHRLIRHLTISASLDSLEELQRQLSELTEQGIFSESEASAVDLHAVANFFRRSLGQRIVRARKVVRELPFSLMLPAQELPMFAERL